jgi:hypothetical protein
MNNHSFNEAQVIHELKHFLPAQQALKDFIHHNSLHAFQHMKNFWLPGAFTITRIPGDVYNRKNTGRCASNGNCQ